MTTAINAKGTAQSGFAFVIKSLMRLGSFATFPVKEQRNRSEIKELLKLDDHMLRDLGVTRDQVRFALRQPLSTSAGAVLNRDARRRTTQRNAA